MAYHQQYQQLIKSKSDFVLFHDVFSCMLDVCLDPTHSALLLQLLVTLCLRVFWKNVFRSLADCITQQPLHSTRLEDACNGEISLICAGISQIFQHFHFWEDIQFITGFRIKQACKWWTIVKQTFIYSHWILLYPSTAVFWTHGKEGKLQSWASTHSGLVNYFQQYQPELTIIELDMIDELLLAGWKAGGQSLSLDVTLSSVSSNLDAWLAIKQGQYPVSAAISSNPEVFLLAAGLILHIQALVEAERQQVQSMNLSRAT
ncbi:hypothetical protein CISG_09726 [Coccidioides immitis RMSCC 3703]|uniref:Uncharacterized protein n=1 Tax=Coccidioides immitis RMSCC 3703 TaxID=454286 RepID=A0A0J8QP07_COCIT|nr:hypothetical protein CISG_09726 [Coccidioides immitis RMSCC 3703]